LRKLPENIFTLIFLSGLLFLNTTLSAKRPQNRFYLDDKGIPRGWIFNAYFISSFLHYPSQKGTLDIKFPYTLSERVNFGPVTTTNAVFHSTSDDLIGRTKWVYPTVGIEIGKENFSVDAQLGWYIHYWSDNLYGGINYRFILKRFHTSPDRMVLGTMTFPGEKLMRSAATFPVKISCGLFYYQPIWKLGTIDVGSKQFDGLGYTMQKLDSSNAPGDGTLTVYFHQNILALKPAFSIGYAPENNRLDVSFTVSPLIILSEAGGLRFYLNNNGNVDWVPRDGIDLNSVIPLNTYGLNATYKGESLSSTPFKLKGWMFTLKLGFRIVE
jgi:hypothetical protein